MLIKQLQVLENNIHPDKKERTLGNISMDNMSINSTKDEICLFDDVKPLAKLHNTISYEILTSLSPSIKRVIV